MQGKQKRCLHELTQASLLMVSWQIEQLGSSEASSGAAWGPWLVLAAGEEAPCSAKSSSDAISCCKQKRYKAHGLPWRANLQEAAQMLKRCLLCLGAVLVLPPMPGTVPGQTSDTGASPSAPALRAGRSLTSRTRAGRSWEGRKAVPGLSARAG